MYKQFILTVTCVWLVFSAGCKKAAVANAGNESLLVQSGRAFFEKEVLGKPTELLAGSLNKQSREPFLSREKQPIWKKATIISLSTGNAVLAPIYCKEPYLIKNNFSGKKVYSSNEVNKLLIYKD